MSAHTQTPDAKGVTTGEVQVSNHAQLRYLQRCEYVDRPAQRVAERFRRGHDTTHPNVDDAGVRRHGDTAFVYERDGGRPTVKTVLPLLEPEPDASAGWREEARHQGVQPGGHR